MDGPSPAPEATRGGGFERSREIEQMSRVFGSFDAKVQHRVVTRLLAVLT